MTRVTVGLAVSRDAICAVPLRANGRARRGATPLRHALSPDDPAAWRNGLDSIRNTLAADQVVAHVVLIPPVVQGRGLALPALRRADLTRVVRRYAARYFWDARAPHVVGAARSSRTASGERPVFASAVPAATLDRLYAAAAAAHWDIAGVGSAYDAWALAAPITDGWVAVTLPGEIHALRVRQRRPVSLRRVRDDDAAAFVRRLAEADDAAWCVVGAAADGERVETDAPVTVAAMHAARARGPELLPDRVHRAERRRARRVTAAVGSLAAAVMIYAAGITLWGEHRDLARLTAARTAIRADVDRAMAEREQLLALHDRLATIRAVDATAPHWSGVIASVTAFLPSDAHLTRFAGRADTLVLEGLADRAAGVFEALQSAPDVVSVRAQAPTRRELRDGEHAVERFAVAARLAAPDAGSDR